LFNRDRSAVNSLPFWRRHEFNLLLAVIAVAIGTAVLDPQHNYWRDPGASAWDLVRQWSMLTLFSLGAAVVIISGGIDLSTGSVIAFSGTICAAILLWLVPEAMLKAEPLPAWAIALAICGTLLSGFLVGSLHAWLITVVGLPPFVATLATLVGLRSLARAIVESLTEHLKGNANTQIDIFDGKFRYLSQSVWIPATLVIVLGIGLWLMLSRTVLGRHLYALGGNEQAARLSGIRTDRLKWVAYCISAMLASLSGVLYICDQGVADPQMLGRGYELNAIAAAVVGGCSLQGGIGTIQGTLLGALFLRAVNDGISKIIKTGADVYEGLIVGVVVVFAVVFTQSESTSQQRRSLFGGGLGLVTILNLTLIAGVLMALVGAKLLGQNVQMNAIWLSTFTMLAVLALLLLCRSPITAIAWRKWGTAWAVVTVVAGVGLDQAYPAIQTNRAVAAVTSAGGKVMRNDLGVVADFTGTGLTDDQWAAVAPKLGGLHGLAEVRFNGTAVTDRAVDALEKLPGLKRIDLSGTSVSSTVSQRLRRKFPQATVVIDEAK